ncbi:MAG: restriction endonuclease subunit S [Deltaproteobacteria bacterium]|nr:restriction endonuclease subunit S [Deltaproteobacteria bacterium]
MGNFLKLEYGKPLDKSKRKSEGKYPVYGANGEKNRTDEFYHDKFSIIIGRKGSAGEINFTERKFWPLVSSQLYNVVKYIIYVLHNKPKGIEYEEIHCDTY